MPHDINTALERLEKNLSDLDSAREQVVNTVNASNDLLRMVSSYVFSIKNLTTNLEGWETSLNDRETASRDEFESSIILLKKSCNDIITAFDTDVKTASSEFITKTDSSIEKFSEENSKLSEKVKELIVLREQINSSTVEIENVKSYLESISEVLKNSQAEQDKVLDEIKKVISSLPRSIQQRTNEVVQAISKSEQALFDLVDHTNEKIEAVVVKADSIISELSTLNGLCNDINSSLSSSTRSITATIDKVREDIISNIEESQAKNKKAVLANRWINIIGIILVAVLLYILK